jgi:hypothetical protein
MAEHGHLFFPGALPADVVLEGRAEAVRLLRDAGWVALADRMTACGVGCAQSRQSRTRSG